MNCGTYFTYLEFVKSKTASELGIKNRICGRKNEAVIRQNIRNLCKVVLDPARMKLGKAIRISSGFRCPSLNKAVGGAPNSYHLVGRAADLVLDDEDELFRLYDILGSLPHKELYMRNNYIHVSL